MLLLRARVDLGAMAMKEVLCIPQSSSIARTSPSDCLVSYPGHSLGGVLSLGREALGVFYSPSRLGKSLVRRPNIAIINKIKKKKKKKKESLPNSGLSRPSGPQSENLRKRKERQILGPCLRTKKKRNGTWK